MELASEVPGDGCGDGGCWWYDGSVGVGVGEERSSRLGRLVHTLERCNCIHTEWRLSFL